MVRTARLTLLDGFTLTCADHVVNVPMTLQRLLAFLGLRGQVTRAHTIGALWPETGERKALGSLRTALWRLQRLDAPVVSTRGTMLNLHEWVLVDVAEPLDLAALRVGGLRELLPGWYDDWILIERERLRQLYLHALEKLAADELAGGRYGDAVESALAAMRAEPLRESPHRLLIEIHLAEGNYSEALSTYHSYRMLLRRELAVSPSPGMQRLVDQVRRSGGIPSAV